MLFIYVHGFNSSPASFKAKCYKRFLTQYHPLDKFIAPELSDLPSKAIKTLTGLIKQHRDSLEQINSPEIALIGSSLGGYYSTWLAQEFDLKAVLVNPAVNPQELLVNYLGKNKNYHTGEEYEFTKQHITQLNEVSVNNIISPDKLMVLLQTGDEVLDYRLAEAIYSQTHLIIEQGGDHSFQNFAQHCEKIYQFLTDK